MLAFLTGRVMPVTYSIDVATKLMRVTCVSPMTFAEVMDHFRALKQDPACVGQLDGFADLTQADLLLESKQLGAVTAELAALREKFQFRVVAIVATRDAVFGTVRMLEVMVSRYLRAIRVFRSSSEAEAWLAATRAQAGPVP
jgi:hypothetical protein